MKARRTQHGLRSTRAYSSWKAMRTRCNNPNTAAYRNHGARGISVDPRWDDFPTFFSDMGERPIGTSLERKDNSKGYGPDNCVWATPKQQARNMRANVMVRVGDEVMCLSAAAELLGTNASALWKRIKRGTTDVTYV